MPHPIAVPSARKGQLNSLQYLRAVAAMMIVFTHGWDQLPWLKERLPDISQSGVDLFFVISGFIMVYVTAKAGSSERTSAVIAPMPLGRCSSTR